MAKALRARPQAFSLRISEQPERMTLSQCNATLQNLVKKHTLPAEKDEPMRVSPTLRRSRVRVPDRFFRRRGALDLTRDASAHRRYANLYEDTLE